MGSKVTLNGTLLFPNDFLAAVEFKGKDVTLTIKSVAIEELKLRGGAKEKKPVLTFNETKKKLVCNKTNADSIAVMHGTEAKAWAGKKITLYPTKATFGRETVDAIRVRENRRAADGPAAVGDDFQDETETGPKEGSVHEPKGIGDADAEPPADWTPADGVDFAAGLPPKTNGGRGPTAVK